MTDAELLVEMMLEEGIDMKARLQRLADRQGLTLAELDAKYEGILAKMEEGRDDIKSLPIPQSGKEYARLKGKRGTDGQRKLRLYMRMMADEVNGGEINGFKNKQVAADPKFGGKM
jgi:hypothetical protein